MKFLPRDERRSIGIIAGSGPEAGVDLWQKVIKAAKHLLDKDYGGDLDAPEVRIISSPPLGLSMELAQNDHLVWPEIKKCVSELSLTCDYIAIACNTLNYYETQIRHLPDAAEMISMGDVVTGYLTQTGRKRVALLGSTAVTNLDDWSAYRSLTENFDVETPDQPDRLHQVIYDVKCYGGDQPEMVETYEALVKSLKAQTVLLACTELPLIQHSLKEKELIDVTQLLAEALVQKVYDPQAN